MELINLEFPRTKRLSFKSVGALISTRELNVDVSETVNEFSSEVSPSTINSLFNCATPSVVRFPDINTSLAFRIFKLLFNSVTP